MGLQNFMPDDAIHSPIHLLLPKIPQGELIVVFRWK